MAKTLVLVYNFPHQIMAIRARNLFAGYPDTKIVCRASNNIIDTIRFVWQTIVCRPTLIYVMDIGIPSLKATLMAKMLSFGRTKVIVDTGDLVYLFSKAEKKYGAIQLAIIKITEDWQIKLADRMVVRAPYHKIYLKEVYGKTDVEHLADGVDLDRFKPGDGKAIRTRLGVEKSFTMGVMGNLFWIDEWKWCYGYYELSALAKLKDLRIKFIVVGDGRGLDKLKEKAKKLGVEDKILFMGRVKHDEVNQFLNAMDVFIFTQPHHLQTRIRTCAKLPELLAACCYIISTDVEEPMKFIDKNGMIVPFKGLIDATYPDRLAKAIRKLYKNRSAIKGGRSGREKAKQNFAYPVLQEKLRRILEKPFK